MTKASGIGDQVTATINSLTGSTPQGENMPITQGPACTATALHPHPGRMRIRPNVPRNRDRIPGQINDGMQLVVSGKSPWPLFVNGPSGCGKTCAALYLADRMPSRVQFFDFVDLCEQHQDAKLGRLWWPGTHAETKVDPRLFWEDWGKASLCIVDEIGTRNTVSDFQYETLKRAIDVRFSKPLIAISNLNLDQLASLFDDRVASRLAGGTVVNVQGDDQRLRR